MCSCSSPLKALKHYFLSLYSFHFCPGIESKLDNINQLKVKGLVLGPLHTVQADQPNTLDLQDLDPLQGTKEELLGVLEKAHRKGRSSDNIATYCHPIILTGFVLYFTPHFTCLVFRH